LIIVCTDRRKSRSVTNAVNLSEIKSIFATQAKCVFASGIFGARQSHL